MNDYSTELPRTELGRRKTRAMILFGLVLLVTAFAIAYLFRLGPEPPPEIILTDVDDFPEGHVWINADEPLSVYDELRRHVVVILFCELATLDDLAAVERLEGVSDAFSGEPLATIMVLRTDETDPAILEDTVTDWGIEFPVVIDHAGMVSGRFEVGSYPVLLILDAQSRVSARYYSGWEQADITGIVEDLLQQGRAMRMSAPHVFQPGRGVHVPDSLAPGT